MANDECPKPTRVDQALWAILRELRDLRRQLASMEEKQRTYSAQVAHALVKPAGRELLSAQAIDKAFRLGRGTAAKACAAGLIPCVPRERGGRRAWLIRAQDAEARWGAR